MNTEPAVLALVRLLQASFSRVREGCDPALKNYNEEHLVIALLAYSRNYVDVPILTTLLRQCIAERNTAHAAMIRRQNAVADRVRRAVVGFRTAVQNSGHDLPPEAWSDLDEAAQFARLVDLAEKARKWMRLAEASWGRDLEPPAREFLAEY